MTSLLQSTGEQTRRAPQYRDHEHPLWRRWLFSPAAAIYVALLVVIFYAIVGIPHFGSQITMTFLLLDAAPTLFIALSMTLIIVTGEIDLSVASTLALGSVLFGSLYDHGVPIVIAAVLALLVGAMCGAFNGFLVTAVGLPSLAVTIGTLALYRGAAVGILGTKAITDFPNGWTSTARATISGTGIPMIIVPFAVLALVFIFLLHFTAFGRGVFAIGQNKEAARYSGVAVARTKFILFTLCGLLSAFAGIYYTLRYGSARGDNANGLELQVIAAVLLGGVSIFGGRGTLPGVIGGVLLIGVIGSAMRLDNYTSDVINIVTGALLVLSVLGPSLTGWVRNQRHHFTPGRQPPRPPNLSTNPENNRDETE